MNAATAAIQARGEKFFALGMDTVRVLFSKIKTLSAKDADELAYRTAMLYFASKAIKSFQAVRVLWTSGFEEDALVITRTLLEIQLQTRYIHDDSSRAWAFVHFDPVSRYRYYKELERLRDEGVELPDLDAPREATEELKAAHDEHAADYNDRSPNWWSTSVKRLAREIGQEAQARYVSVYKLSSDLVHSGVTSAKRYISDPKGEDAPIEVKCAPEMADDLLIPEQATLLLIESLWYVLEAFAADVEDEMNGLLERFKALSR